MQLLFLGDSLVEWGDWRVLLPAYQVENRGRAGEPLEGLSARLNEELRRCPQPALILIMSGTNNLLAGEEFFPAIFHTMLPRLRLLCPKSTPIIVNALLPMPLASQLPLKSINRELEQATRRNVCHFLDPSPVFQTHCLPITRPCFHADGVHLSTLGYTLWAGLLGQLIDSLLKKNRSC